MMMIV